MKSAIALLLMAPLLALGQVSFTGTLDPMDANQVVLITFQLVNPTTVSARSWGAGGSSGAPGGTNAEGTVIAPGGFDPYFSLFSGTGPTATFLVSNDDGLCPTGTPVSGVCLDPTLLNIALPAGTFTLAVSVFSNFSFQENLGTGALGDGFILLGNYYSTVTNTVLAPNYAVDLFGALIVSSVTPVPGDNLFPPGQPPVSTSGLVGPTGEYQLRYAANLNVDDGTQSVINITNSGAASSTGFPVQNGDICVNVYAYSPDEQLISCCSCLVTPNGLVSLSVKRDLTSNTLTPIVPSAASIALVAARRTGSNACDPGTFTSTTELAKGMEAWGTSIHALPITPGTPPGTYGVSETPFSKASLSQMQLNRMAQLCTFMRANGSGYGICKSCRVGGLGASSK